MTLQLPHEEKFEHDGKTYTIRVWAQGDQVFVRAFVEDRPANRCVYHISCQTDNDVIAAQHLHSGIENLVESAKADIQRGLVSHEMFEGFDEKRAANMTSQEQRWFDNVKKAFYESDLAYSKGKPEDRCFAELCKAVDTAKTLRRSLRGEDTSSKYNKTRFIEFLSFEIPTETPNSFYVNLIDARTGEEHAYSFPALLYAIRCMVHENENLNVAERPDYHIQVDWSKPYSGGFGEIYGNERIVLNGHSVWKRFRQILAKFITGLDGMIESERTGNFSITIAPPLLSIRPSGASPRE